MQRFILNKKNYITAVSALLIATGFISGFGFSNETAASTVLITASILGAAPIAIQAYQALKVKVVSIDLLVTIAVTGAFLIQNYEESAIVTFLFLFGAFLEQRTLNKTRSAIKELTEMAPESALKQMAAGDYEEIDIDEVDAGDVLLVKTGAKIPVDGRIISGEGYIDEASITGEPFPVAKEPGAVVYAGSILDNGTILISADRIGEDTTFGKIIELVEEAQDSKSAAERFIDRFAKYYTPAVLVLGILVWIFSRRLELAITILVLGCPGALVIGVPVSNVAGIGNGARNGILLKGSEVIKDFSRLDTMVFDKTGTLTAGKPAVVGKEYYGDNIDEALGYLASVERESDHPLAQAVVAEIGEAPLSPVENTEVIKGRGIIADINGHRIAVGSGALMEKEGVKLSAEANQDIARFESGGNTLVLTSIDGELKILMGIGDQIRPGVKRALAQLKTLGIKDLIMLSGDNQGAVDALSQDLGLTKAYGNMLPQDKPAYLKALITEKGQIVAFVGDGINDSPALALAHIGIAMGGGTDVAIETSNVVLMHSDFNRLPHALGLAKAISRNMKQNIYIALGVVLFLLAGLFFSKWMNMSLGMFVHEASILVVIFNGMRLLGYKLVIRKGK